MVDYNADSMVDLADYLTWCKTMGQSGTLLAADGNASGTIDAGDYDVWRASFGEAVGAGGSVAAATESPVSTAAVPEPLSFFLLCMALVASPLFHEHLRILCDCRRNEYCDARRLEI